MKVKARMGWVPGKEDIWIHGSAEEVRGQLWALLLFGGRRKCCCRSVWRSETNLAKMVLSFPRARLGRKLTPYSEPC